MVISDQLLRRVLLPAMLVFAPVGGAKADTVVIEGVERISAEKAKALIADQVKQIQEEGATRPRADDAAYFLEQELHRRGFQNALVIWEVTDGGSRVVLKVDEGQPLMLGDRHFPGVVAGDKEELDDLLISRTEERSGGLFEDDLPYVENDLEAGTDKVQRYYLSRGYWGVKVWPMETERRETSGGEVMVDITLPIDEGQLYRFRQFRIESNADVNVGAIQAELADLIGQPATTENVTDARARVKGFLSERGFFRSEVTMTASRDNPDLVVDFSIQRGRRFTVREIEIRGNEDLKEEFLRNRYDGLKGQPYDPENANAISRKLIGMGLFNRLRVEPVEQEDGTVKLLVNVDEALSREIGVYAGVGTFEGGIFGVSFLERNLFGSGNSFAIDGEISGRTLGGHAQFKDPWLFDTQWTFGTRVFLERKELEGYRKSQRGVGVEVSRPFGEFHTLTFDVRSADVEIFDASFTPAELGDPTYVVNTIGITHVFDTRDDPVLPRKGVFLESRLEYGFAPGGGGVRFARGTVDFSAYFPVGEQSVLAVGARTGMVVGVGDGVLPIDLRFFSGGASSVRSFQELQMPPLAASGEPLGGEVYNTFNIEYTTPIRGALRGAVFFDAGNLLRDSGDYGLTDMHYAAGMGLRYDLPTGPIRVDYGFNLNRGDGEPPGAFHFTVGVAF